MWRIRQAQSQDLFCTYQKKYEKLQIKKYNTWTKKKGISKIASFKDAD